MLDYAFINFWRIDLSSSIKACHTTTAKETKWCKDNQNHKKYGHSIAQSAAETEMGTASGWSRNNVIICDWETSCKRISRHTVWYNYFAIANKHIAEFTPYLYCLPSCWNSLVNTKHLVMLWMNVKTLHSSSVWHLTWHALAEWVWLGLFFPNM